MSLDSGGAQGNFDSSRPALSGDGRFVAFASDADNLVPGDTNGVGDVFLRERSSGITTRVSVDGLGLEGNDHSAEPAISADGMFVAFRSRADNLVAGDFSGWYDIFVHNVATGTTVRVSVDSIGTEADGDSGYPSGPALSADGRYVVFQSSATNLVVGDTNGTVDMFVHDRLSALTTRVSLDSTGTQANGPCTDGSITPDGRFVVFQSLASNLVANDTNGRYDIFRHDRVTGRTLRASVDSAGVQGNRHSWQPSISADGRLVAFASQANNLVSGDAGWYWDVFLRDMSSATTERVSVTGAGAQANGESFDPSLTPDGRYLVFQSYATNIVRGDDNHVGDVFVRDLRHATTELVSVDPNGASGDSVSYDPRISDDGRLMVFTSRAASLVSGDTNASDDIFARPLFHKVRRP